MSSKAARTRARLLTAARVVFERDGFLDARVVDIAQEARVSHGTFYTYFDSKQDIFRAVVADFRDEIYERRSGVGAGPATRIAKVEAGNRQFHDAYIKNLRMFDLYEGAAAYDDAIRENRIEARRVAEQRVRTSIERFQREGLVPAHLNAEIAASCLVAMATHSFYTWHIREDRGFDHDEAIKTLSYLWSSALGLRAEPEDEDFYQTVGHFVGEEMRAVVDDTPPPRARPAKERAATAKKERSATAAPSARAPRSRTPKP